MPSSRIPPIARSPSAWHLIPAVLRRCALVLGAVLVLGLPGVATATPPDAPTALRATAGNGEVGLWWTAPTSSGTGTITDYVIEYSADGASFSIVADGASANPWARVTGLVNGISYTFRVSATGAGTGPASSPASATPGLLTATAMVGAGQAFSCGLSGSGAVNCWGWNERGRLGRGTSGNTSVPTPGLVAGLGSGVAGIAVGREAACALMATTEVMCWGYNWLNALGDGTTTDRTTPVYVLAGAGTRLTGAVSLTTGNNYGCARLVTTEVRCWGMNGYPVIGDGTTTNRAYATPTVATGQAAGGTPLAGVASLAPTGGNTYMTCARMLVGGVKCWGQGYQGDGGTNAGAMNTTPVDATSVAGAVAVAIGGEYGEACVIVSGGAKCWGKNELGQVGDGSTTNRPSAMDVSGLSSGVTAITHGDGFACAVLSTSEVRCWGANGNGQLGDGTSVASTTPVSVKVNVSTNLTGVVSIEAGDQHVCAVRSDFSAWCWGMNEKGQRGDSGSTGGYARVVSAYTVAPTYGVTYQGNGSSTGSAPTDATVYTSGATVTVSGNTGSLVRTGYVFDGWCTTPPAAGAACSGTSRTAASTFAIAADTTLYAVWTDPLPGAPTGVSASDPRSSGRLDVVWTAPSRPGTSSVIGYTVTSTPDSRTCTGAATGCTVTGLSDGTAYTFTVTATNGSGTGSPSVASSPATPTTVPGPPTGITVVSAPERAEVSWTAPVATGGTAITGYTVTSIPDGRTCTGAATTCTVTGLTNGTAYTFTVIATNTVGPGSASAPFAPMTPATAPGPPGNVQAISGNGYATVTWAAPDTGGAAITAYTVTASPGGQTCTSASGPLQCVVTGLTNGVTYTFAVSGANAAGTGRVSSPTAVVTPAAATLPPSVVEALARDSTGVAKDGGANVAVACGAGSPCEVQVVMRVGRVTITSERSLAAGESTAVTLDLPTDIQRKLARAGTMIVMVRIAVASEAGTIAVDVPVTLRAPPADRAADGSGRAHTDGATDLSASCQGTLVSRCAGTITLYSDGTAGPAGQSEHAGERTVLGVAAIAGPAGEPIATRVALNAAGRRMLASRGTLWINPSVAFEGDTRTPQMPRYSVVQMTRREWLAAALRTLSAHGNPRHDLNRVLGQVATAAIARADAADRIQRTVIPRRLSGLAAVQALPVAPAPFRGIEQHLQSAFRLSIAADRSYLAWLRTGSGASEEAAWRTSIRATRVKALLLNGFRVQGRRFSLSVPRATALWP